MPSFCNVLQKTVEESQKKEDGKEDPDPIEDTDIVAFSKPRVGQIVQEGVWRRCRPAIPTDAGIGHGHDHAKIDNGVDKGEEDVRDADFIDGIGQNEVRHRKEGDHDMETHGREGIQEFDTVSLQQGESAVG